MNPEPKILQLKHEPSDAPDPPAQSTTRDRPQSAEPRSRCGGFGRDVNLGSGRIDKSELTLRCYGGS